MGLWGAAFGKGQAEAQGLAVAAQGKGYRVARVLHNEALQELVAIVDFCARKAGDDIACLDAGVAGRASVDHASNQRPSLRATRRRGAGSRTVRRDWDTGWRRLSRQVAGGAQNLE